MDVAEADEIESEEPVEDADIRTPYKVEGIILYFATASGLNGQIPLFENPGFMLVIVNAYSKGDFTALANSFCDHFFF